MNSMMKPIVALSFLILMLAAADGEETLIAFDDLLLQPVDKLEHRGVRFQYELNGTPSDEALYGSFGPGTLTTVADPSLIGDSRGILTLHFERPATDVSFGVAVSSAGPLEPGFTTELFGADSELLGVTSWNTANTAGALGFSETRFEYSGTPLSRIIINFANGPENFALDNLAFVPEPNSVRLVLTVLFGLLLGRRRLH